jgi:hypothetical protein
MIKTQKPHVRRFLDHLKSMSPGESTDYWDFADPYDDELEGFELAMELLSEGHPIHFSTHESRWINNASPEGICYHKASRPNDLDGMEAMIRDQLCYLRRLLCGLQKARNNLRVSE